MRRAETFVLPCLLACFMSCDAADAQLIGKTSSALASATVSLALSDFAVWSVDETVLSDRVTVTGAVGSANIVKLGVNAAVTGDVVAGKGGCDLRNGAVVDGNLTTSGKLKPETTASVTGTVSELATVPALTLPAITVSAGTTQVIVDAGLTVKLPPGSYSEVRVNTGGSLVLTSGTYQVGRFILGASSVRIEAQTGAGPVVVNVAQELLFGDATKIHLVGSSDPKLVQFYSNQTNQLRLGVNSVIQGIIAAPKAEILVPPRTSVFGSVYGKRVVLDADATLNSRSEIPVVPVLTASSATPTLVPKAAAPVLQSHAVTVDVGAIQSSKNQRLQLELFPNANLTTVGKRIERHGADGYVWLGQVEGQPQSLVTLAVHAGVLAADVRTETGKYYQIRNGGNVYLARELDAGGFGDEGDSPSAPLPGAPPSSCGGTETGALIDALVVYTPAVRQKVGSA